MNRNSSELEREDRELLAELAGELAAYKAPPPPPSAREAAAQAAVAMLAQARPSAVRSLWRQLRVQARFLPLWYYGASLALCALGVALLMTVSTEQASRLGIVIGMTPLPALLGLLELFHGADEGMGEIESACRYSPARVLIARMVIVGTISAAIAAAIGAVSGVAQGWMAAGIVVVPFCAGSALGLALSAALHGRASSAQVALAIALVNGAAAMAAESDFIPLLKITPLGWALAMAASALALAGVLRVILTEHSQMMERKLLQWN